MSTNRSKYIGCQSNSGRKLLQLTQCSTLIFLPSYAWQTEQYIQFRIILYESFYAQLGKK